MIGLTNRQSEVLNTIKDYTSRFGFPPTVLELAGLIGVASPNAAADHVNALKRKGYISVARGAARGITIIKDNQDDDAVSIIKYLLEGEQNAKERAVAWLELQGVKL